MSGKLFTSLMLGPVEIKNRLIRSSTFEGMGDVDGNPTSELFDMYEELAKNGTSLIIAGFNYTSKEGKAMQPGACGMDEDSKIAHWKPIVEMVHSYGAKIIMQITHAGRQTVKRLSGGEVFSPSKVKCTYFRESPKVLSDEQILKIVYEYAYAALRLKKAGMDGVQVHCAHGYLIHQFFSSHTNRRKDRWGGGFENRFRFASLIFEKIRKLCGNDFLIMAKVSSGDERGFTFLDCLKFCKLMEKSGHVDSIEISYGTMEYAMNIFRGEMPVKIAMKHNPLFNKYPKILKWLWLKLYYPLFYKNKIIPFKENYNAECSELIAEDINLPVVAVGGIRRKSEIARILEGNVEAVSSSRMFLHDPDITKKMLHNEEYQSGCSNCNVCVMMCDSGKSTKCWLKNGEKDIG
ncbi:MAG: NADH:flavin oxidoreductase [Bacteriovoracaceae bacterium]|nr:NADH:flavin oxidoreductase [Bacteriovoracaceae bacterium]